MATFIDQIKAQYNQGTMNLKLIMINVGLFIATLLATVIVKMINPYFNIMDYIAVPSDFGDLLFKPWTIISYMFTHSIDGIGHLFWNMVLLYFAGRMFEQTLGTKKLLSTYFIGGLAGYALFAIGYNYFPAIKSISPVLVGASAAVTAIFVAIGVYVPNYEIRIPFIQQPFKLIYVVAFFVILDIVRLQAGIGLSDANTGGGLAHLGGTIFGAVYALQLKQGKNISKWFENFVDWLVTLFKPGKKLKVKYRNNKQANTNKPPRDDYEYNEVKVDKQKQIDSILDKISKSGYESLSKKEKDFLFKQSNN